MLRTPQSSRTPGSPCLIPSSASTSCPIWSGHVQGGEEMEEREGLRQAAAGGQGGGKGSGKQGSGSHPKKIGMYFVTDRDGKQLCNKFSKGQPGACSEPRPDSRTHGCHLCLAPHPNCRCPKNAEYGGKDARQGKCDGASRTLSQNAWLLKINTLLMVTRVWALLAHLNSVRTLSLVRLENFVS